MKRKITTPYGMTALYTTEPRKKREQVAIIPGYSGSIAHTEELVDILANKGYTAFTYSPPRTGVRDPVGRQKDILLHVLESVLPKDEKVHAVAHSFSVIALLKAAVQRGCPPVNPAPLSP